VNARPPWLEVRSPSNPEDPDLPRHRGERDAIKLALELRADLLLMDEERPRKIATGLGIQVIGTIGVLEQAANRNLLPNLKAVHELIRQSSFHVAESLLDASLRRHQTRAVDPQ
jgi:predicted nucleic acid-binding protein